MLKNLYTFFSKQKTMTAVAIAMGLVCSFSTANAQYSSAYYAPQYSNSQYYQQPTRVSQTPTYGRQQQRRRYKQPSSFDTISDTGTYLGVGFSTAQFNGDRMQSETCDPNIRGNCSNSGESDDNLTNVSFILGMAVSSTVRLELNYGTYSGMKYGNTASAFDGTSTVNLPVQGGDIDSTVFMANFYYTLEKLFGNFSGGRIVPYFGLGVGVAFNKVSDYSITDTQGFDIDTQNTCFKEDVYEYQNGSWVGPIDGGVCDYIYNGQITYTGNTTQDMAWMLELGATWKLQNQVFIDLFVRYNTLGTVETGGVTISDYDHIQYIETEISDSNAVLAQDIDGGGIQETPPTSDIGILEVEADPIVTAHYGHKEKTEISITEFGVKFRVMF